MKAEAGRLLPGMTQLAQDTVLVFPILFARHLSLKSLNVFVSFLLLSVLHFDFLSLWSL